MNSDEEKDISTPVSDDEPIVDSPTENEETPYEPADPADAPDTSTDEQYSVADVPVSWTAHEYIHLEKGGMWYVLFVLVALGLIAVDVFLLRSYTFSALVVVMSIALIIYSRRPPRNLQYTLSLKQGLYVGEKLYSFNDFKEFGIIKDGDNHSIMLIPAKRFAPGLSVYFPEESGEEIVDILGNRLPMRPLKLDFVDLLVRRLRL